MREGFTIIEAVKDHINVMDMVEVNPSLSDTKGAHLTANNAKHLLLAALAGHRGT